MTAMAYQLSKEEAMKRARPLLKTFRLENELKVFPSHFSKGMKQKGDDNMCIYCQSRIIYY